MTRDKNWKCENVIANLEHTSTAPPTTIDRLRALTEIYIYFCYHIIEWLAYIAEGYQNFPAHYFMSSLPQAPCVSAAVGRSTTENWAHELVLVWFLLENFRCLRQSWWRSSHPHSIEWLLVYKRREEERINMHTEGNRNDGIECNINKNKMVSRNRRWDYWRDEKTAIWIQIIVVCRLSQLSSERKQEIDNCPVLIPVVVRSTFKWNRSA